MLSIIIPTLNEEKYLPLLLEAIKKQNFNGDYEVIVADADSEDKTVELAKSYGCRVIPGGLPAKGRNEGAKVAQGDAFLFVDSDTVLSGYFLEKALKEFKERNLDVAGFFLYPYQGNKFLKLLYNLFYNWWPALAGEKILPHASNTILVKKKLHQKLGGFDEEIKIGEDHAYAREAAKMGRFGIIRSLPILVLTRRFECDGWLNTYFKYILCELWMVFGKNIKSDIFEYRFDYSKEDKKISKDSRGILKWLKLFFQVPRLAIKILIISVLWLITSLLSPPVLLIRSLFKK